MKFRQEKNEARPVDRDALRPGDYVEHCGEAYFVCPDCFSQFAVSVSLLGCWSQLDGTTSLFRIHNIHQDDDDKLTWDRVTTEPKPVAWEDLEELDLFAWESAGIALCQRAVWLGVQLPLGTMVACALGESEPMDLRQVKRGILYRAELVEIKNGTLVWRTK